MTPKIFVAPGALARDCNTSPVVIPSEGGLPRAVFSAGNPSRGTPTLALN